MPPELFLCFFSAFVCFLCFGVLSLPTVCLFTALLSLQPGLTVQPGRYIRMQLMLAWQTQQCLNTYLLSLFLLAQFLA